MSGVIRKNIKDSALFAAIDENVRSLVEIAGSCERLFRTPIPTSYTSHTSRFLTIWALLLPFGAQASPGAGVELLLFSTAIAPAPVPPPSGPEQRYRQHPTSTGDGDEISVIFHWK